MSSPKPVTSLQQDSQGHSYILFPEPNPHRYVSYAEVLVLHPSTGEWHSQPVSVLERDQTMATALAHVAQVRHAEGPGVEWRLRWYGEQA